MKKRLPQFRVAVNSRCGRRCTFCRPSGEAIPTAAGSELTTEIVLTVTRACKQFGIDGVKLTGGDPALWSPLLDCVQRLKGELDIEVQVISRHPHLAGLAAPLARAGIDLFNVSLDTLNPNLHRRITGIDDHAEVLAMVKNCAVTGKDVKVNMVVIAEENDHEIDDIIDFCERNSVRTLKLLDVIRDLDQGSESYHRPLRKLGKTLADLYVRLDTVIERLRSRATSIESAHQGGFGHPMTSLVMPSGLEVLVKDHSRGAWYGPICDGCQHYPCHDALMALRLTADARLQFCLLREENAIDLRPALSSGEDAVAATIDAALGVYAAAQFYEGNDHMPRSNDRRLFSLPLA